ncbi:hypothetical protein L3X38_037144 [Prunus dulcis]|uniref:Uncharacterized protein n=1 Tax=Prunus dulcis TaxID=3755 RepID=A0AAD4YP93_PRUDU|nr:hypothetical protein L3X38_037144 [Prunus dulcis]
MGAAVLVDSKESERTKISEQHSIKSLSQRDFKGGLSHRDEVPFFHKDSAFHFELPESGYEVLSRLIFTLFEGSKITDGDFRLDPKIVVMKNIFHLLPENLPICSTEEAWGSSPLNKVKFGTLKPGDRGVNSLSTSLAFYWWREWIGVHPSGSIGQHSWAFWPNWNLLLLDGKGSFLLSSLDFSMA